MVLCLKLLFCIFIYFRLACQKDKEDQCPYSNIPKKVLLDYIDNAGFGLKPDAIVPNAPEKDPFDVNDKELYDPTAYASFRNSTDLNEDEVNTSNSITHPKAMTNPSNGDDLSDEPETKLAGSPPINQANLNVNANSLKEYGLFNHAKDEAILLNKQAQSILDDVKNAHTFFETNNSYYSFTSNDGARDPFDINDLNNYHVNSVSSFNINSLVETINSNVVKNTTKTTRLGKQKTKSKINKPITKNSTNRKSVKSTPATRPTSKLRRRTQKPTLVPKLIVVTSKSTFFMPKPTRAQSLVLKNIVMVATTIIPNKKIVAKANIEPKTVITKPNLPEHDYINYNSVNKEALGMNSEANAMIEQLRIDKDKVDAALNEGKSIVDQRHNEVDQINQRHFFESADHQYSPTFAHYHMAKPKREALRVRNKAEILLETTKIIMREKRDIFVNGTVDKKRFFEVATKEDVAKIISTTQHRAFTGERVNLGSPCIPKWYPCNINSKFRTITGWCNNIKRPHYGMAFGAMVRLLPPQYENGIDQPRIKAINGMNLYSPRIVSNIINEGHPPTDNDGFSHVASLFGQFIAHDITHAPIETNKTGGILVCSKCDSHQKVSPNCLPIEIPLDDPYYPPFVKGSERRCLPYTRSLLGDASKGYREQMVQVTPYIDLSALYGSTDCEAKELRSMVDGQMKHCEIKGANSECLPKIDKPTSCRSFPKYPCFLTGDVRSSDTSALSGLHNIFLREHNKISAQFKKINPHWNDERIYQETRRLLGALFQHMVYNEYVPLLIGPNLMHQHITYPKKAGYFEGYNYTCDGMISQAFQTSAFRFGHSLILNEFARLNGNFEKMTPNLRLVDLFNNAESMYNKKCSGFEGIILGTVGQASNKLDRFYTDDLRNRLFEVKEKNMYGFDLLSINIQRGRDHALPGYNDFRQYCGFSKLRNWKDLKNEMEPVVIKKLRRIYNNVDDIDLYVGLITEKHNYTTHLLPKTSACIVADQFARLKKCDRYFYENNVKGSLFTQKQLNQIRKYTFNRLLCDNIKMLKMIQRNPFRLHNLKTNPYIPCSQLLSVDLRQWKEKPPVKKSQTNP